MHNTLKEKHGGWGVSHSLDRESFQSLEIFQGEQGITTHFKIKRNTTQQKHRKNSICH